MGRRRCCCELIITPDDVCPVCAESTVGGASISFATTLCGVPAGTYAIPEYPNYVEGPPAYCTWVRLLPNPDISVWIYSTGRIDVIISAGGNSIWYRKEHFTGDPPFICNIEDLEIPFLYNGWPGCSLYPPSVLLSL